MFGAPLVTSRIPQRIPVAVSDARGAALTSYQTKRQEGTMRGVVFTGDRELEMMEFPDPTPGPDEVVVEMKASGMCGSDLHQYRRPKDRPARRPAFRRTPTR